MGSPELFLNPVEELTNGIHAFYDTQESILTIKETQTKGTYVGKEAIRAIEPTLSFSKGAGYLYRNSMAVDSTGAIIANTLPDGRVMFNSSGKANLNVAVELRSFNISGKQVIQFVRNSSNQPDKLAWYIDPKLTFPSGSRAYLATYWLGDDEIVVPAANSFTGTKTFEELINRYSKKLAPLCMSYVHSQNTAPYGVIFPAISTKPERVTKEIKNRKGKVVRRVSVMETPKAPVTGQLSLLRARSGSLFCEIPKQTDVAGATWKIRTIQGTRVMEIIPDSTVNPADVGIQPVNQKSVGVGFAEIVSVYKGKRSTRVVPVKILRNNQPIVDFRLKFNDGAAGSVRQALAAAAEVQKREARLIAEQAKNNRSAK